ncbi:MAG: hypothetical protein PWP11_876 [Thauera sp.]|nr:hypothetical protein [Thauera sp.]MDI3489599.1 hypothetical protein [Thauera sp.]
MDPRHPFHATGIAAVPPATNRRADRAMRTLVDLVEWAVDSGNITVRRAGELLSEAGVPFEVACRVLPKAHRA